MREPIHGRWNLGCVGDRILVAKVFGSWNAPAAEAFAADVKALAPGLERPWALLVDFLDWQASIPEVEPLIRALNLWGLRNGCGCLAEVTIYHTLMECQRRHMDVPIPDSFRFREFEDLADATAWLTAQGYAITVRSARNAMAE